MAFDPTKPATTDNYSTGFVPGLIGNLIALSQWLDSSNTALTGTPPTFAKRYNRGSGMFEEYSGSVWGVLAHNIPGNAATATSAGDSAKFNGQLPAFYQPALGYTPLQQGGGTGQGTNKLYIGWATSLLNLQVDTVNFGSTWPIAVTGNAGTVTNGVYTAGNQTVGGIKSFNAAILSPSAGDYGLWKTGDIGGSYVSWNANRVTALQVDAAIDTSAYMVWRATKWGARHLAAMDVYAGGTASSAPVVSLHVGTTTNAFTFDQGGNLTAAGNVTAFSDARLKKDWAALPGDFVERLASIQHGSYTRIDTGARQAGVSAQDLQALLPEAVHTGTDEQQTLSVAYGNAALVACVALARELGLLRAEVQQLRGAA
jgi:Chaperone of endosialidase